MNMEPVNPELELAKAAAEGMGKESINKLSEVIGNIFPFWDTKRIAVETYIAEVQKSNLSPVHKMAAIADSKKTLKHLKNQSEIASIAMSAAKEGTDFSGMSSVDDEWLDRFMDSAKFVSNEQIQAIWGYILAKEFENPGSTPPSITRILTEITPKYAKAFQILCSLNVTITALNKDDQFLSSKSVVIVPNDHHYLSNIGLDPSTLNELQALGLILYNDFLGYSTNFNITTVSSFHVAYGNQIAIITHVKDNIIPTGCVQLTQAGETIFQLSEHVIMDGYFDALCSFFEFSQVQFTKSNCSSH